MPQCSKELRLTERRRCDAEGMHRAEGCNDAMGYNDATGCNDAEGCDECMKADRRSATMHKDALVAWE